MKKVLIITYYWPPSGGAGVQRWVKFAKYLSRLGHQPIVLTVDPKFATYPQIDETLLKDIPESVKIYRTKSFELYSVYKKVSSNKEVPYGGFANTKKVDFKEKILRFIRGNFFIPDPRRGWNKYAILKAKEIIEKHDIDTVITTSPPHSTQLIGLKLKKQLDINWIADFRDPWTDIYYYKDLYPTFFSRELGKSLERKVLKNADQVLTVSYDLKRLLSSKVRPSPIKISVIPNGYDNDDFAFKYSRTDDYFYISYVGTISKDYDINSFVESLVQLPDELKGKLRIRFIGKIINEHIDKFTNAGLKNNLEIINYVEHRRAIQYMLSSDVLLLIIPSTKNNKGILTGKLFEYIASNRRILFLGPEDGDAAKIINETESGIVCSINDTIKIKESILFLYNKEEVSPEITHAKAYKYSRENLTKELIEIL